MTRGTFTLKGDLPANTDNPIAVYEEFEEHELFPDIVLILRSDHHGFQDYAAVTKINDDRTLEIVRFPNRSRYSFADGDVIHVAGVLASRTEPIPWRPSAVK